MAVAEEEVLPKLGNMNTNEQIDPDVKNLVSAMGLVETGTSSPEAYQKRGASGEYGRYQFMPDTWKQWASESGINTPLEQASIEEQNRVAYNKVKQWKDQGLTPAQIASKWNSGDENAYKNAHVGTNSQGVAYDTPAHVMKVSEAYQQIKNRGQLGGTYQAPPQTTEFTPATSTGYQNLQEQLGLKEGGYFSQLGQDFSQLGQNITSATNNDYNIGSKALQFGGAVAGTAGDVIDTTLSNLPVVGGAYEKATDVLGKAIGGAMDATGASEWMAEHPEAAANIGAGLDVLSVVPFFKALKYGKAGIRDATTAVTAKKVEEGAANELKSSLTKPPTRTLDRAEKRGLDPMGTIVKNPQLLPDIIESNGRYLYDTKQATQILQRNLEASEVALQNLLASTIKKNVGVDLNAVKAQVIKDILPKGAINVNASAIRREVGRMFDDIMESAGRNYVSLNDLNEIKRQVRSGINFDAIDPTRALTKEVQFDVGQSIMRQVEKTAEKAGAKGVKELNKKMANDITAKSILEFLDGRPIKAGGVKNGLIKSVGKTIPGVEGVVDYATRGVPLTPTRRLKSRRPLPETTRKGLYQTGGGLALSGQLTSEE